MLNITKYKSYLKNIDWLSRLQAFPHRKALKSIKNRGFNPNFVLDVGAAWGGWSKHCMKIFPEAKYFLIDPLIEYEKNLLSLKKKNITKIDYLIASAGSQEEYREINVQDDLVGSSFLKDSDPRFSGQSRFVKVVTIDNLIKNRTIDLPDLIKLDAQGFETEVLDGAKSILGLTEVIIMEISLFEFLEGVPQFADVINYMDKRSYDLYDIAGFINRPLDGALAQIDCVFVNNKSALKKSNLWFHPSREI
jgi:FkbM family methyltransferase